MVTRVAFKAQATGPLPTAPRRGPLAPRRRESAACCSGFYTTRRRGRVGRNAPGPARRVSTSTRRARARAPIFGRDRAPRRATPGCQPVLRRDPPRRRRAVRPRRAIGSSPAVPHDAPARRGQGRQRGPRGPGRREGGRGREAQGLVRQRLGARRREARAPRRRARRRVVRRWRPLGERPLSSGPRFSRTLASDRVARSARRRARKPTCPLRAGRARRRPRAACRVQRARAFFARLLAGGYPHPAESQGIRTAIRRAGFAAPRRRRRVAFALVGDAQDERGWLARVTALEGLSYAGSAKVPSARQVTCARAAPPRRCEEHPYLQFMRGAADPAWTRSERVNLPPDCISAVDWNCQRSFEEARRERSQILRGLTAERRSIVERGELDSWFAGVDPVIRKVAGDSCPPLMERLARRIGWHDADVVEFFRQAAPRMRARAPGAARAPAWPGRAADRRLGVRVLHPRDGPRRVRTAAGSFRRRVAAARPRHA